MRGKNGEELSIHQRISNVLKSGSSRPPVFTAVESSLEVDRLEFQLARAQIELRAAQQRVDELSRALETTRKPAPQP